MSFLTPFASRVISPIEDGEWELLDRVPTEAQSGWDSMRDTWLVRLDAAGTDPAALLNDATFNAAFDRGEQVSGYNMWIVGRNPRCLAAGLFKVEISSIGLLSARGYKISYDSTAAIQNEQNLTISGTAYLKVRTREGAVSANLEYILFAPDGPTDADFITKFVGRNRSLPTGWAPSVPATIWAFLSEPTYNYPNGWILESAVLENIPGIDSVFLAREKFAYLIPFEP